MLFLFERSKLEMRLGSHARFSTSYPGICGPRCWFASIPPSTCQPLQRTFWNQTPWGQTLALLWVTYCEWPSARYSGLFTLISLCVKEWHLCCFLGNARGSKQFNACYALDWHMRSWGGAYKQKRGRETDWPQGNNNSSTNNVLFWKRV